MSGGGLAARPRQWAAPRPPVTIGSALTRGRTFVITSIIGVGTGLNRPGGGTLGHQLSDSHGREDQGCILGGKQSKSTALMPPEALKNIMHIELYQE